jgi:sec-independent protein translocase protein TatB
MFGIDSSELFVIGLVALLVIGPQRLPLAMRSVGQWVAKGRAMTRHVRSGFDAMIREAELEEMQKAWAKQNEAIMKATEMDPTAFLDPGNPLPTSLPAPADEPGILPEPETPPAPTLDAEPAKPPRKRRAKKATAPAPAPDSEAP